jgi:metal-sulfur cluster biosynthetic enzyme
MQIPFRSSSLLAALLSALLFTPTVLSAADSAATARENPDAGNPKPVSPTRNPKETSYQDRTDSVDQKLRLLETAHQKRDFRLARALAESLRQTLQFEEQQEAPIGAPVLGAESFVPVSALPAAWREWARGWAYAKVLTLEETAGEARSAEPVELVAAFRMDQTTSLAREVRVVRVEGSALREVRSQVTEEIRRGNERQARLTFFADSQPRQRTFWLVLYGNPDAELPDYPTDLKVAGEGFGLDIENEFFRASLSKQMGQLERLAYKREHGQELFAGGDGHGEPAGIDWAHDYVTSGNFQKLRITNWPTCPDYEVIRGPLSLTVRRWGFPYSPIHPVFTPARMNIFVEYRFYAGTPWFIKTGSMQVIQDIEIGYLRDDEWVFSGMSFTDILWMGADGKLRSGTVAPGQAEDLWGVGFFHRETRDAFFGLFLEHTAENAPPLKHTGAPTLQYKWHGQLWSRALYQGATLRAGAVLRQKNAYLTMPFPENGGAAQVEGIRRRMLNPLVPSTAPLPAAIVGDSSSGRLARSGEAGDSLISKKALWEALANCRDEQLYETRSSIVDLGLVYDLRVRGDVVHVVMATPSRGRPRIGFYSYGSGGNYSPVRDVLLKVPGVGKVVVEQTWQPAWNPNRLTAEGRRKLGLQPDSQP